MATRRRRWRVGTTAVLAVVAALLGLLAVKPQWALEAEFARQRWVAGATSETGTAADHLVAFVQSGSGDVTVVFIHGFTGSKENFLPLMARLRGLRLLAPDLPGWGGSERKPGADYGYAAQAERLADWLQHGVGTPVVLVGHSMGGGIAALVAARHPALVRKLVLMDAAGVPYDENEFGLAVLRGENPFAVTDRASLDRYLSTVFVQPPWVPWPADRALIAQRSAQTDFEQTILDAIGRGPDAFLPEADAAKIAQPVLLLWCLDDRVIDSSAADRWRDLLPGSTLAMLQGCNHMPMMERPAETAALIEEFVR